MDTMRARLAGHPEARPRERMNPIELWALIVVLVIVLNAIPAFMPPTWALLAYFHVDDVIDIWAACIGRRTGGGDGQRCPRNVLSHLGHSCGSPSLVIEHRSTWRVHQAASGDEPVDAGTLSARTCSQQSVVHRDRHLARAADSCLLYTSPSPRDRTRSRM